MPLRKIESAGKWAAAEFGGVELGDARRTARVVEMAEALAQSPGGVLPGPLPTWAEMKAGYRLLENPAVTHARLQQPHWERTRQACQARGAYLLIEDTTALDFTTHWATAGLGQIGNDRGRGFHVHTTLALRIERWLSQEPVLNMLGLFWQQVWAREGAPKKGRESKAARWGRKRESERWAAALDQAGDSPPGTTWTLVADREADIAEVFIKARQHATDFIIRACQARALAAEEGDLFAVAARAPLRGELPIELRARPGQAARTATVQVRARELKVRGPWRPGGSLPAQTVNVIEIQEAQAPAGVEPLRWVLLTSWPCGTLEECLKVARAYGARWLIEEYHKALKSGTVVEQSQLTTAARLEALLALLALVAVRLLDLKLQARAEPEKAVTAETLGAEALAVLEAKHGRPKEGWTNRTLLVAIAKLGGFPARKGDGDPGWLTIWRGWQRLVLLIEGYSLRVAW
jgi:hypothetical protein